MAIIYSDTEGRGGFPTNYHAMNAVAGFLRHYENWLTLDFIAKATKNTREKLDAIKEMEIAERKMGWWKHHPNYEQRAVTAGIEALKKKWEAR